MILCFIIQFTPFILLALWIIFFIYRYLHTHSDQGHAVIVKLLICIVIVLLSEAGFRLAPYLWWLQAIIVFSTYYSYLLGYLAIDQLLNNRPSRSAHTHKFFPVIIVISTICFLLEFGERDSLIAFLEGMPYHRSWEHYTYYIIKDSFQAFLLVLVVGLYWQSLHKYVKLTYFVQRCICIAGLSLSIGYIVMIDYPMLTTLFTGHAYHLLKQFQWIFKELPLWLLTIGFIAPDGVLAFLLRPFDSLLKRRQVRKDQLLGYLHEQMLLIVPNVHLSYEPLKNLRVLVEIRDARQIVWSNFSLTGPMTSEAEADHLFQLLKNRVVLREAGYYQPPETSQNNIMKHDLAVAKRLMRLLQEQPLKRTRPLSMDLA